MKPIWFNIFVNPTWTQQILETIHGSIRFNLVDGEAAQPFLMDETQTWLVDLSAMLKKIFVKSYMTSNKTYVFIL